MPRLTLVSRCAISDGIPRRSFYVAVVVGTILNLINQGDTLFGSAAVNWTKIVLTYLVPYAVATYGALSYRLSRHSEPPDTRSAIEERTR
jgi:hypothetical protein